MADVQILARFTSDMGNWFGELVWQFCSGDGQMHEHEHAMCSAIYKVCNLSWQ